MLYAVTLNPAIDKYIYLDEFNVYETNYYHNEIQRFGGKAINVAKMLNNFTSDYILITKSVNELDNLVLNELSTINKKLFTTDHIRINYKVCTDNKITELNKNLDQVPNDNSSARIFNYLKTKVGSTDIIIFTGAMTTEEIDQIKKIRTEFSDLKIVIDSSSISIADLKFIKPFIYKPNIEELEKLFGIKIKSADISKKAQQLNDFGIEHVIVSQGAQGGTYVSSQLQYHYTVYHGNVINTVGAGDSFLASFIYSLESGENPTEAIDFANACACATVFTESIATKLEIENLSHLKNN